MRITERREAHIITQKESITETTDEQITPKDLTFIIERVRFIEDTREMSESIRVEEKLQREV